MSKGTTNNVKLMVKNPFVQDVNASQDENYSYDVGTNYKSDCFDRLIQKYCVGSDFDKDFLNSVLYQQQPTIQMQPTEYNYLQNSTLSTLGGTNSDSLNFNAIFEECLGQDCHNNSYMQPEVFEFMNGDQRYYDQTQYSQVMPTNDERNTFSNNSFISDSGLTPLSHQTSGFSSNTTPIKYLPYNNQVLEPPSMLEIGNNHNYLKRNLNQEFTNINKMIPRLDSILKQDQIADTQKIDEKIIMLGNRIRQNNHLFKIFSNELDQFSDFKYKQDVRSCTNYNENVNLTNVISLVNKVKESSVGMSILKSNSIERLFSNMSHGEFKQLLSYYHEDNNLVNEIKEIRRKIRNKFAARMCRKKKMDEQHRFTNLKKILSDLLYKINNINDLIYKKLKC